MSKTETSFATKGKNLFLSTIGYFKSKPFILTLVGILGTTVLLFFLVTAYLSWYTNHGQRLQVGEYLGLTLREAQQNIEDADFRMEIIDSIYLVNKPPHLVLRQNPEPGSFVKENRRIYLTITKAIPDEVVLPSLAGTYDFDRYKRKINLLDIDGKIRERRYSNKYQSNTILEVYYDGVEVSEKQLSKGFTVPKGSVLEFIVSSKSGGSTAVPNVACKTLDEARFYLENYRLKVGDIIADETVDNKELAYVVKQEPSPSTSESVPFNTKVKLFITKSKPDNCTN